MHLRKINHQKFVVLWVFEGTQSPKKEHSKDFHLLENPGKDRISAYQMFYWQCENSRINWKRPQVPWNHSDPAGQWSRPSLVLVKTEPQEVWRGQRVRVLRPRRALFWRYSHVWGTIYWGHRVLQHHLRAQSRVCNGNRGHVTWAASVSGFSS